MGEFKKSLRYFNIWKWTKYLYCVRKYYLLLFENERYIVLGKLFDCNYFVFIRNIITFANSN